MSAHGACAPQEDGRSARRPIVYDASHLTSRLPVAAFTGIDFVDRAFAAHLSARREIACGAHYGLTAPHVLAPHRVADLSAHYEQMIGAAAAQESAQWRALTRWLKAPGAEPPGLDRDEPTSTNNARRLRARLLTARVRLAHDRPWRIPQDAIYLNVAQYGLEHAFLFRWLDRRPDVKPVFFSHDLLPLDHPQYFRDGYGEIFRRRFQTILTRAAAIVTTTRSVKERIGLEYERRGRRAPPVLALALPSPLEDGGRISVEASDLAAAPPYVVMVGTIEPRKNHALMLDVWRRLTQSSGAAPKLVCVGGHGWDPALVADMAARAQALGGGVRFASNLPAPALRALLMNARALAAPSFAEGYGIPLVEALTLGAPVICSDIPVFRETTQNCATFIAPDDADAWMRAVADLTNPAGAAAARRQAQRFKAPNWTEYFDRIDAFLASL